MSNFLSPSLIADVPNSTDRAYSVTLSEGGGSWQWFTRKCKILIHDLDCETKNAVFIAILVMATAGVGAIGDTPALSPQRKAAVVNFVVFINLVPDAISEADPNIGQHCQPSVHTGYWVLFSLSCIFDHILQGVTPYYLFVKGLMLAWGASSGRPHGGRSVLASVLDGIDDIDQPLPTSSLDVAERLATQANLSPKTFRLGLTSCCFASINLALGLVMWALLRLELYVSTQSSLWQARMCVIIGAAWPMYRTIITTTRTECFSPDKPDILAGKRQGRRAKGSACPTAADTRQGPAAMQWLSYWPMFAFLQTFTDPVLGQRIPHYYSVKLVVLALLALPYSRGAYIITSLLIDIKDGKEGKGQKVSERQRLAAARSKAQQTVDISNLVAHGGRASDQRRQRR